MEPLKKNAKERILEMQPQASPEEIGEYERLLAQRFASDPDLAKSPEQALIENRREKRIHELYIKLFAPHMAGQGGS